MSTDLELVSVTAWQAGYAYAVDLIADVLDDVRYSVFPLPRYSHEERVQRRVGEMEAYALASRTTWRGQYPGGPVDFETGRALAVAR